MTSRTDDLETLEALNRGYLLAAEKSDVAWYTEHLAEDYRATNPDGSFVDKAGFLARIGRRVDTENLSSFYDRLLQSDNRGLHVDADLVDAALHLQLVLAELKLVGHVVGLRRAIAKRDVDGEARGIIGEVAAGDLAEHRPRAADEIPVRIAAAVVVKRIRGTRQAVVRQLHKGLQVGQ